MSKRKLIGPVTHISPAPDNPLVPAETSLHENNRSMPDLIARGGVFFPTRETLRLSQPLDVSMYHTDYVVRLDNRLLSAQHIALGSTIVQLMDENKNSLFSNSTYGWLKDTYGRTGGPDYERFRAELHDFANATMYITNLNTDPKGFEVEGSFLSYYIDHQTDWVTIHANSAFFRYVFGNALTKLDKRVLNSMRDAVSPLLYMFYNSHKDFYRQPRKFSISSEKLEHIIGLDIVAAQKGWPRKYITQELKRGHDRLVAIGFLVRWELKNGIYTVYSKAPDMRKKLAEAMAARDDAKDRLNRLAGQIKEQWAQLWPLGSAEAAEERAKLAASRAIDFYDAYLTGSHHTMADLIDWAMVCIEQQGTPEHIGWLANPKLWETELLEYLYDMNVLEAPETGPSGFMALPPVCPVEPDVGTYDRAPQCLDDVPELPEGGL